VGEIAAKAVVELLFSTGKSFTVDGLREKLREFFRQEVRPELRTVAALSNADLITALLCRNLGLRYLRAIYGERRPSSRLARWQDSLTGGLYAQRDETRREHLLELLSRLGLGQFGTKHHRSP
jgi:hypothetical protein